MNFTEYYKKEFSSRQSGAPIYTSRAEWESAPCPIDMTLVTDAEMQELADKIYLGEDGETFYEEAENWLMTKTAAMYLEDYSKAQHEEYGKRAKKLYYK